MLGQLGQTWTAVPSARHQDTQLGFNLRPSGSGTPSLRQQSRPGTGLSCKAQTQPQAGVASARQQQAELSFQASADSSEPSNSQLQSAPSPSLPGLQIGSNIAGRYEVLSVSSQQGSTTVYTARGPNGQKVAVKALSLQSMANWDELEAFERESRALRALGHGHAAIPAFVEVFEEDNLDRTFYLVQELVEGETLAQRLAQGWRASPATLQRLASQLLQALQAMRQAAGGPISHNAITPHNIILKHTPQGLQACLVGFASAEQLPGDSESTAAQMPPAQLTNSAMPVRQASHAEASSSSSSSSSSSWEVQVDNDMQSQPLMYPSPSAAQDAQLVTAALSEALATNVEYAAPEALGGEARMGASDAFSVGAVLAAAASGAAPQSGHSAQWEPPRGLVGTRVAAVIQRLMQPDWQRRLTPDQALAVLAGQPMPALPSLQRPVASKPGLQGLAQRVLQLGRDARANTDAALSQRRQQQTSADGSEGSRQPRGSPIPVAVLGLAAATLFLGPSAPLFLFTFLPVLAAGSSGGPRFAPAGVPYPRQPGMGFQMAPRGYVSPLQQQQMLRMMLARQQAMQSAQFMQRRRQQQMWGGFR